jgi:hypothetical protein
MVAQDTEKTINANKVNNETIFLLIVIPPDAFQLHFKTFF